MKFGVYIIKPRGNPHGTYLGSIRQSPQSSFVPRYSGPASTSGIYPRQLSQHAMCCRACRVQHVLRAFAQRHGCRRADTWDTGRTQTDAFDVLPSGNPHNRPYGSRTNTADLSVFSQHGSLLAKGKTKNYHNQTSSAFRIVCRTACSLYLSVLWHNLMLNIQLNQGDETGRNCALCAQFRPSCLSPLI